MHTETPGKGATWPRVHAEQTNDVSLLACPGWHTTQGLLWFTAPDPLMLPHAAHAMERGAGATRPAGHAVQFTSEYTLNVPRGHTWQTVVASTKDNPSPQVAHALLFTNGAVVLLGHAVHSVESMVALNFPVAHGVHAAFVPPAFHEPTRHLHGSDAHLPCSALVMNVGVGAAQKLGQLEGGEGCPPPPLNKH